MAETVAIAPHAESADAHAPYLKVFVYLLILTVMEYVYAKLASSLNFPFLLLVLGLLVMALTKAVLVAMYFMHLKYEGRWVYLLVVPACLMAVILVLALYPDIGVPELAAWPRPTEAASPTAWTDNSPTPPFSLPSQAGQRS